MGSFKKILKKAADPLGLFTSDKVQAPEVKTPAKQLTRETEVEAEDITTGADDETSNTKGKRALLRPTSSSSLGGI